MTKDEIEALIDQAEPVLAAQWGDEVNRWGWPSGWGEAPPAESDLRIGLVMKCMARAGGYKEWLRVVNREELPGDAFDAWWNGRGSR